ncbi:MAG TPA: O-antigen ligase family protein [Candidatus Acidoferrales bacterium]|nr:O-antigen ligase family protein [Candidatus Acidoferrales bacterium]
MRTRLSAGAATLVESGWLAALIVVPVLFNQLSERTFDEDKVGLLRAIAIVVLVGLIIWSVEEGRGALAVAGRPLRRVPLIKPVVALAAAYVVSTAFSVAPRISFWGAYLRTQGTYTWLSCVTLFCAVVLLARRREHTERLVNAALLASLPAAVYGLVQHFGDDPIHWGTQVTGRVVGTQGNAVFLAAFLIMVVPLTLARMIDQMAQAFERRGAVRFRPALLAAVYVLLLVVQLLALVFTQSRGPFIGLLAGLLVFGLVFALYHRARWLLLATTALAVGGLLFLLALNFRYAPLAGLSRVNYVNRLNYLFNSEQGTGKVRTLIWQSAVELLAADPLRDIAGYGPEALYLVFSPFYPAELAHVEDRKVEPDRAHNETLDALIMTGVVGMVAELAFVLCLIHYLLRLLHLSTSTGERNAFVAATVAGGVLGGSLPYFIEGRCRFCALGLPFGMFVGLLVYLIACASARRIERPADSRAEDLLLMGVLGGIVGHFIEIQFSIVIASTRLYFWMLAGLAVAIGMRRSARPIAGVPSLSEDGRALVEGGLAGLLLIVLTFDFCVPTLDLRTHAGALLGVLLSGWVLGLIFVVARPPGTAARRPHGRAAARYALASLGLFVLFTAIYAPWIRWRPGVDDVGIAALRRFAGHVADATSILYVSVFMTMGVMTAVSFLSERPRPLVGIRRLRAGGLLYAALLAGAVPVIVCANLSGSRADTYNKLGGFYEGKGQLDAADALYEEAVRLQPYEERYAVNQSGVLMEKARSPSSPTPQLREESLRRGLALLQRAIADNPLNPHHPRNLARLYRLWAAVSADPAQRARYGTQAHEYYEQATQRSPHNASLWDEWATLYFDQRQIETGVAKLEQSLRVDPGYTTTFWLRGNADMETGQLEKALSDYDSALAIDPQLMAAWSGKALALARLNRFPEAIAANRRVLALHPGDLISHRNLALLYKQIDQLDSALSEAQAALAVAHGNDRPGLEALIAELTELRTTQQATNGWSD